MLTSLSFLFFHRSILDFDINHEEKHIIKIISLEMAAMPCMHGVTKNGVTKKRPVTPDQGQEFVWGIVIAGIT